MRRIIKKATITAQIAWPGLADLKFALLRAYRGLLSQPHEQRFSVLRVLSFPDAGLLLDIGGDMGQSVASLRIYCPQSPIVSFEPNPLSSARIERRFHGDPQVRVQRIALGDQDGEFPLYIPAYKYTTFPELGTLDRTQAENWLSERMYGYNHANLTVLEVRCRVHRLDSLALAPVLVKIDCRCNASAIILGGSDTLGKSKAALLLEAASLSQPAQEIVQRHGYRQFAHLNGTFREVHGTERCDLLVTGENLTRLLASALAQPDATGVSLTVEASE